MYSKRVCLVLFIVGLCIPALAKGQIETQDLNKMTLEELVERLLGGSVEVSHIEFTDDDRAKAAAGAFHGGTGIVGFEEGIILSSGKIADVVGPNDHDGTTTQFGLWGDSDLDTLVPQGSYTHDAVVLEFDALFPPGINSVSFRYVFTSEEYNEYTNSPFTNVFGFFVNGVNYALLPDGATPVAINNVNGGRPATCDDGVDNDEDGLTDMDDPDCTVPLDNVVGEDNSNSDFFINNDCQDADGGEPCPINVEADGLTVVLDFVAPVIEGQTNHIKLGIADVEDAQWDSWVFIEAGSLAGGVKEPFDPGNPSRDFVFEADRLVVNVTFEQVNEPFDLTLAALEVDQDDVEGRLQSFFDGATCLPIEFGDGDLTCVVFRALNPPSPNPQYTGGFDMTIKYFGEGVNPRMVHDPDEIAGEDFTEDITADYYPEAVPGSDPRIRGFTDNWSDFLMIDAAALAKCIVYGFDPPIFMYKVGPQLPVMFQCFTAGGELYKDATAYLSLSKIVDGVGEPQPVEPATRFNVGNTFLFVPFLNKYAYSLKTAELEPGKYVLTASSADFNPISTELCLLPDIKIWWWK